MPLGYRNFWHIVGDSTFKNVEMVHLQDTCSAPYFAR